MGYTLNAYPCSCLLFSSTLTPSDLRNKPLMLPSTEHPSAFKSSSTRQCPGGTQTSPKVFPASTAAHVLATLRTAAAHPTKGLLHLSLATTTPAAVGITNLHTGAQPDFYLTMTGPSSIGESSSAVVWGERRRPDTGNHVDAVFQTGARGLPDLASRPGSSLDRHASRFSATRRVTIPCGLDSYLLARSTLAGLVHESSACRVYTGGP